MTATTYGLEMYKRVEIKSQKVVGANFYVLVEVSPHNQLRYNGQRVWSKCVYDKVLQN